jgi:hypothetical protein
MMAFLVLLLAIIGQMHMVLPSFCIGAMVLLLPASIKVNFDSLRWQRRPRARRPVPTSRTAPVWVTTSRYWFVEEERERVSESVHG